MEKVITQNRYTHRDKYHVGGFLGALLSIISMFFIIPLFEKTFYTHLFLQCSFTVLILSTIYMIDRQRTILIAVLNVVKVLLVL